MNIDLQKRLEAIYAIISDLKKSEEEYFLLEAHKDVLFSGLFSQSLAKAHAAYNEMRRKYELRMKAFDAEYLSVKIDGQIIPRGLSDDRGDRER